MEKQDIKKRIEELTRIINYHNNLYYTNDSPEIEDSEYDKLFRELETLENKYPELRKKDSPTQRVGFAVLEKFEKFKHPIAMYSLSNVMNEMEWLDFHNRMVKEIKSDEIKYTVENKFDGLALELIYVDGKLSVASTRGDGITGENVTSNVVVMDSVPKNIDVKGMVIVRGEVLITKKDFNTLNEERLEQEEPPFANPRNAAAGGIRNLDSKESKMRKLKFFAYQIANYNDLDIESEAMAMEFLKSKGFDVEGVFPLVDKDEVIKIYNDMQNSKRKNLEYEIDGLVIKVDNTKYQEKLGFVSRSPRFAVAFKFKPEEKETVIEDIDIQVGRTGAMTPVARVKPVSVGGVTVTNVTLHNPNEIKSKDIRIGDTVCVIRSGDVIPKITRVIFEKRKADSKEFIFPDKCPVCGGDTAVVDGEVIVRCINENCSNKITKYIEYFVSKPAMNIEGLGKEWIEKFTTSGLIKTPADIYKITKDDLFKFERMGEKLAENILSSIETSKTTTLKRFIYSLGIRQVGESTADMLAKYFTSIDNFLNLKHEDLLNLNNIGEISAKNIYDFVHTKKTRDMIKELIAAGVVAKYTAISVKTSKLTGKNVVITGSIEGFTRSSAKEMAERLGAKIQSGVSKTTDILIVGEDSGSKLKKAQDLGITIMSAEEFTQISKG